MTKPSSSTPDRRPRSVWTRRNLIVAAVLAVIPPIVVGVLHETFSGGLGWPRTLHGFLPVAAATLAVETAAITVLLVYISTRPRLSQRFEVPELFGGDEREQAISLKACRLTFVVVFALLMYVFLGTVITKPGGGVPVEWIIYIVLVAQGVFYGSSIYYNRKM